MFLRACLVVLFASPASTDITIVIRDGNPWDTITVSHDMCGPMSGRVHLDLESSAGNMLIDTVRGGAGTKDPMPVEVLAGPIIVEPVRDGDRQITFLLGDLPPNIEAVIGLDFDNETGWWPGPRVEVWGEHILGTAARIDMHGGASLGQFGPSGTVILPDPVDMQCNTPEPQIDDDTMIVS